MQQPQHEEACPAINDEDGLRTYNDFDSTSNSDLGSFFDSSDNEADTISDTDSESPFKEVGDNTNDDDDDDNDDLFEGEVRHPPEYYLAAAASLDAGRLRQKRYSPKTQIQLNMVKEHYDQYVSHGDRPCSEYPSNVALLLDTTFSPEKTPLSAFKRSRPISSTAFYARSAINDEGKGDRGGPALSKKARYKHSRNCTL